MGKKEQVPARAIFETFFVQGSLYRYGLRAATFRSEFGGPQSLRCCYAKGGKLWPPRRETHGCKNARSVQENHGE